MGSKALINRNGPTSKIKMSNSALHLLGDGVSGPLFLESALKFKDIFISELPKDECRHLLQACQGNLES